MQEQTNILNVRETARILGVHENTVRNWAERGLIRAMRLPGSGIRRFLREDVERMREEMFTQFAPDTSIDSLPKVIPKKKFPVKFEND